MRILAVCCLLLGVFTLHSFWVIWRAPPEALPEFAREEGLRHRMTLFIAFMTGTLLVASLALWLAG